MRFYYSESYMMKISAERALEFESFSSGKLEKLVISALVSEKLILS